jgi:hypothetical protein
MFRKSLKITSDTKPSSKPNKRETCHESYTYSPTSVFGPEQSCTTSVASTKRHSAPKPPLTEPTSPEPTEPLRPIETIQPVNENSGSELNSSGENLETEEEKSCETGEEDDEDSEPIAPVVQVKYPCEYDYNEQKFVLHQDEKMFLITKTNEDWWLCLRLEENLPFFAPASYLREIQSKPAGSASNKPPPRPPPPPPALLQERLSSLDLDSSAETGVDQPSRPEVKKRKAHQDSDERVYQNEPDEDPLDPSNIISDLDERLNFEDKSSFVDEAELESEPGSGDKPVVLRTFKAGGQRSCPTNKANGEPGEQNIYQNVPLRSSNQTNQDQTAKRVNSSIDAAAKNATSINNEEVNSARNRFTRVIRTDTSGNKTGRGSNGDKLVDEPKRVSAREELDEANNSDSENVPVPRGWHIEPNKYDRKCYVNELTGERVSYIMLFCWVF